MYTLGYIVTIHLLQCTHIVLVLTGKIDVKGTFWRPRHSWEDYIKTDLKQNGKAWTGLIWIRTEQVVGCCEHDI